MKDKEIDDSKKKLEESLRKLKESNELLFANFSSLSSSKTKLKPLKRKRFTKKIRAAVLLRQNSRCNNCGMILDVYDFDHIDGDHWNDDISNCQALCPTCHRRKSKNHKRLAKAKTIDFSSIMIELKKCLR